MVTGTCGVEEDDSEGMLLLSLVADHELIVAGSGGPVDMAQVVAGDVLAGVEVAARAPAQRTRGVGHRLGEPGLGRARHLLQARGDGDIEAAQQRVRDR